MLKNHRLPLILAIAGLLLLALIGCAASSDAAAPDAAAVANPSRLQQLLVSPTSTPIPTPTPVPVAGQLVPVLADRWEVTIEEVVEMTHISPYQRSYSPNEGYTFLVVNTRLRLLEPTEDLSITSDMVAIIGEDGVIHPADGAVDGCVGCVLTSWSTGHVLTMKFVFVIPEETLHDTWKLQFKNVPSISFSLDESPVELLVTEMGPLPDSLPPNCANPTQGQRDTSTQVTYRRWNNDGLEIGTAGSGNAGATPICTGLAFGELQHAPDGAALLTLYPESGWPSLLLIEPEGDVTALVRNGDSVTAEFDASGRYVKLVTRSIGVEGAALHVYDRQTDSMSLILEGSWIRTRYLADGQLLIETEHADTDETQRYLAATSSSELEEIKLPTALGDSPEIAADGRHVLYERESVWDDRRLYLAQLDGSSPTELATSDDCCLDALLSPDAAFALISRPDAETGDDSVGLLNLASGELITVTTTSGTLSFDFSPDSRWALVYESVGSRLIDQGASITQTLHVVDTASGASRQLANVNTGVFSPDGSRLAYTVMEEGFEPQMFLLHLTSDKTDSLGAGIVTGWRR